MASSSSDPTAVLDAASDWGEGATSAVAGGPGKVPVAEVWSRGSTRAVSFACGRCVESCGTLCDRADVR